MRSNQQGVALFLALMMIFILSVLGISVMFVAQTETWSSMNYRLMTQARYGAEAGLSRSLDYIANTYVPPAATGTDLISNYNITPSQPVGTLPAGVNQVAVSYNSNAVILSGSPAVASNYPVAAVQTAFNSVASGTITAGNTTINYAAYATMISMNSAGTQIWQITSDGTIDGIRNADVEVQAILEKQTGTAAYPDAAFATAATCGAMSFSGSASTNSYDSSAITCTHGTAPACSGGSVIFANSSGNVGTNGNLGESGGVTIYGTLSTPRSGVGTCSSGNVDALSSSGSATVNGGLVHLPQTVVYPTPAAPTPAPPTTNVSINSTTTYAPGRYGNLTVSGGAVFHISAGTYNLNSLSMSGGSSMVLDSGPIIINITGAGQTTPINFSGGAISNAALDPSKLIINYGGTGNVTLSGGTGSAAIINTPNAALTISGGADFYGAVVAATVNDSGGTVIHYDRHLASMGASASGNWMLNSFSWKKY